jgi:hypothetical protein
MNDSWSISDQEYATILNIIEQALECKISSLPAVTGAINIPLPEQVDDLAQIKYYAANPQFFANNCIADLVKQQLENNTSAIQAAFVTTVQSDPMASFAQRWLDYSGKLEQILQQIQYRHAHNYELNTILPPQKQMLELQQECWQLTEEWYGPGNGNISCFYIYYIRMCEAAHITRYTYNDLPKNRSADGYVTQVFLQERAKIIDEYKINYKEAFLRYGGQWAQGRCDIDATSLANTMYYTVARRLAFWQILKQLVVNLQGLEDFGQLPAEIKEKLWSLHQGYYPINDPVDVNSIFYKFADFCNSTPGACFTDERLNIPELQQISVARLHAIIKAVGLKTKKLVLFSRNITENWTPKRYLVLHWLRKYPLQTYRKKGVMEHMRMWPNEMGYFPSHGLSLCGNGLLEGLDKYSDLGYEWNVPIDVEEEIDNTPRDIEKMFRELKMLCPASQTPQLLPGEELLNLYQNLVAYSTQASQHIHIAAGAIENFPLFMHDSAAPRFAAKLNAQLDLVQIGTQEDAFFLKIRFASLANESVIQFLINLENAILQHFDGTTKIDSYTNLFPSTKGDYVFIYEPHARLIQTGYNLFLNPENNLSEVRKPQLVIPTGIVLPFPTDDPLAQGLNYLRDFYDKTCKAGAFAFISGFINQTLDF